MWTCLVLFLQTMIWTTNLQFITGNSFPPEILSVNVKERIPENTKFGVTVATVTASDRDTQFPDNVIRFQMFASQLASEYFAVDSLTGNIFVKRDLTLDTSSVYQVYVQAYDMGSPSRSSATNATVTIDIYRNLRDPFFSGGPFAANISETTVIGTSILQVNFGDSDTDAPFNTVTVSAIGDDKALTYFRLDSDGRIAVNSDLKANSDTRYLMRIFAQDGGSPPRTATTVASITVQRNTNSPVFERQSYNETILETRQLGLSFLQVKATDGDTRAPYNEVRYFISSDAGSALGAQYFMVDDVTGDISLRQSPMLDNARNVDYTFTVNAVDRGGRSATIPANVRVTVIRNTNAPVFTNLPNANQINHNASTGAPPIFTVFATDPDPGVFGQLTYSLTGDGESTSVFNINQTSGVITLQQSLFSQTSTLYTLRVRVQDGGSPRKDAMSTLTLTVQRNFETPRFVSNSYTFTIKENEPIGFSVGQIVATDADAAPPNNLVEYYFAGSTPSQRFLIDSRTGVITIRKDLTTEETLSNSYNFRVQARDSGSPQRVSQEIPLTINVQRNDYDPLFGNLPFSVTIPANANQFSTVYTVNSTDADTVPDFQRREYDIIGDDAATSLFAVDPTAGRIAISSLLTSDPAVQYRVRVRVRDFGTPRRSSTSLLLVNVTRNLNNPQFNPTQYFATILETHTLGSSIQRVSSTDLDTTAPNNVPTYTLSGNALALQFFQVNPSTGVISLYKDLRDNTATSYTLTVTVADNGSPSLAGTNTATVTVQVNRNLQPPRFINAPYSSTITRLVADNSLLPGVTISTADDDTVSPFRDVTVSVIGDDSAVSLFELAGSSVRVRNAANLAADTANTYKLRLLAEDGGSPKKTATTTIDITVRRNLVPPQFNPAAYNATILENYPVGSEIVMVTATDSDPQPPNNQFKYSITGDATAMTYFYINPDSGRISLKQSIKGTGVNQFRLQVTATDEGTPSLSGQVIVTVDVTIDDTLRFTQLQPYTASIDENDPVDRGFITVIATPQPNIKYSIVGFSDSPDYFKIDETTGTISVKTDLRSDLSKRATYLIQVRAEKQFPNGLQSVENQVNVTVLRNINPPVFNSTQYQASINEKYGLGQSVVQVFATDLDTQDVLLYSIIDQAGETEPFYMAPSTGIITLKQLLTGTTKTSYSFTVRVRDQSKPEKFGQSTVVINVRRNSQSPVFERTPYGAAINYNQAPGFVYSTNARDADLTGTMTYEVIGYFSAPGYFTVNSNGGINLLSSLASDTALSYTLGLAAFDSDYPNDKAYANVTLTVNRNPNAPEFTNPSYSITVNESYPLAVSLLQVSGQDADQHDVQYVLESSNPVDGTQFFYLNPSTGVLTVSRPLTETVTQTFTLQVRLRDNGIPVRSSATTAPVTIFITRNNNGPIFAGTFTTRINETTPTNTPVLTVTATDSDPNTSPYGQLRYRLIGDGDFTQFFNIDPTTGSISVRRPLTSQDVALYQGRIVAEDGGSPPRSATATATINILRNLNAPVFNPRDYPATIYETHQVGVDIVTVTATDADQIRPNNEIIFEMSDTTPNLNGAGSNYFSIRSSNNRGLISITLPLYTDNLNTAVYTFSVRARDNGSPTRFSVDTATVTITVYRNLFPPIFQGEPYTASLNFNSPSGSTVRQVNATDADAQSPHNTVTYSIIGDGTAQTLFSINPATGLITTRQSLQNNNVERSSILVMARDGGTPSLTATSTVSVTIARNLNAPVWVIATYTVNITETQDLGTPIAGLSTRDDDVEAPYNTRITTLTGDPNMMQFFSLSENGQLSVKKQLTSTNIRTFTGTVSLRDGGNPPLTPTGVKTANITVYVTKNDHTPYFISEPYSKDLEGTIQLGASVFQVTGRDDDRGLFGLVRYRITGDDLAPNYFRIDENSGLISIKNALSGVNQNQFKVRVEAYDGGSPSKTNVSVVTLTVKSNYQRPVFNRPSYFARIPETQSLGQQIIAVTANDSDALAPNNVVRYSLTEGADDIECFLIDALTGSLSLRRSLLYAPCTGSRYQMTVTATDLGLNPLSNTVTVTVDVDRNANPPVFQNIPAIATINENQPTSQGFFTVRATDIDTVSPFKDITYSLVGDGTATVYFEVDSSTGLVSLRQSIQPDTASTYRLTFRATDGGNPPRYDEKILTVNVNRNLLAPEFVQQVYDVTIWEIQSLDTVIQEVSARDNDTKAPHNEVTYEIVSDTLAQTYFRIDNEGRIYVRRPLTDDTADTGLYTLSVRANDRGTPQRSSNTLATVRVTVLRNRNCPTFASSVVDISIDQSSVSRVIYDANATDLDAANTPFSTVRYLLIGDENAQVFFRVDDQTGQVSTNGPSLFSDQGTIYQLRVRAEDAVNTVTSCSGTLVLRVTVNRNLNSPQWTNVNTANNYVTTISETHSVSLSVYRIQAVDTDDKAPNNVVSYAMTANSPNRNLFFVDVDGFVYLRNSLVGITGDPFTVRFVATDGGNPARTSPEATLTVNVNRNQFPPEILNLPAEKEIQENQLVNEEIYRVNGRDNDTVSPFNAYSFELVGDGSSTTFFQVSPGGSVTLRQSISSDPATSFQLRVRVQDGGTPRKQDEELLTIKVNKNLFSPVMTTGQYSRQILETQTVSLPLVTVQATDGDQFAPNNQLRYFIVGSNTTITDFFMVNEDSGAVMLRRSMLDYPNTASRFTVNFQVNAEDKGSVPRQANNPQLVSISVIRNTAPFFENEFTYNTEVQQFTAGGTVVFTPIGRDDDTNSPFNVLTYSLIGDDAATTVFQINPNTGAISTRPTTNLTQTTGNFVARVQVTDGGSPPLSDTATVQITIQRNRESPRFLHAVDLTRNIPETLPAGSEIIDLNATDDDFFVPNNVISYVITGGDGNPLEYFFIHPSTGVIVLLKSVKSISTSNFRLNVEARDQGAPMRLATATVHINVLRDTGVLAFSANNYDVTISENTPVGASVTNTVASPGTSIEYSLLGVSSGPDYFSVNAATGLVSVRQQLTSDPARLTFYQLRVQAINRGVATQTATATVNITVTRNENGPVFRPSNTYTTTVEDTIPLGFNVTLLSATDADGDQPNYRIISGSPYTDLFYLNPVTGQITLKNVLQGRAENQYTFQVQVSDQRTPERTANATVIVNVIKDRFAPQFIRTPYLSATTENTPDGTIIFGTEAIDQDLRERIEYTVIGDNAAPAFFGVIPDKGNITIINQALLRKDVGTSYTLRLTAHDTRYPNNRATATVTVQVTRNVNSPVFFPPSYSRTILDTVPLGYQVVQVNATDGDNDPIRYSITGDPRAQTYYYINPETGWITVKQLLTTGNWLQDQIAVQACDLRDPQNCVTTFAIITIDRNEQSPFFLSTPYSKGLVQGTTASETVIFTVNARDPDLNPSTGSLRYETIGNYPAPSFFSLNTTTGEIKVTRGLMEDGLQRSQYNLVVIAYDTQYPADRATATVTFNVNRNPNSPVFTQSGSYLVTVPESLPLGSNVTQVLATDADNDVVSYFISPTGNTGQEDLDFFYLNAETGVITLKSLLTSTTLNTFTFDVVARDPSGKTGNAVVTVIVTRDQPPEFVSTPYSTTAVENQQINSKIFTVAANDRDRKGQIVYGVVGSFNAPFYFGVDNSSGEVAIINDLKTDIRQQYDLVVTAYDSGSPGKTATATLTLTVVRNPSVPEITSGPHRVTIWEDRAPGSNILNITARDNDGDTLRYELLSDGTAESIRALMYFTIDPITGLVYVARTLMDDPTRAVLYKMKVRVRDQQYYEKQTEADVEITVNRNQQSPFFLGTYAREIPENTPLYTSILQVAARDSDMRPISSLRYEATGFGSAPYFFHLSPTNGSIYVQNDLRSEKSVFTYILQVQAYDVAYPLDRAVTNVTITIRRNENAPQFDQFQYSANISENTARNVVVLRLNATDRDVGDRITYAYDRVTPTLFSRLFYLSPTTGFITVSDDLTTDNQLSYTATIFASDNSNPEKLTSVRVTINVYRDRSTPQFSVGNQTVTVSENAPIGASVTRLTATDNDKVGVITYVVDGIYPAPSLFAIHPTSGEVTVAKDLQFEAVRSDSQYKLTVVAYDSFRPLTKASATVTILVIRNPSTPRWDLLSYNTTIREDHPPFSSVVQVNAVDADAEDKITYDIVNEVDEKALSSGQSENFYIDTDTGVIYLKKNLMNTPFTKFILTVQACDDGVPHKCANTTVAINISEDKNAPVFLNSPYSTTINENYVVGRMAIAVRAVDSNPLSSIRYMMEPPVPRYFTINEATGNITVAKELNTSLETTFQFKVSTYDSGEPQYKSTADVTIFVIRNLNAPRFLQNPISVTVDQNAKYNFMVANTTAEDADGDILRYTMTGNPLSEVQTYFGIDPDNGDIFLRELLTNPPRQSYQLFVFARDQRLVNEKTGTATVNVFIDMDDAPRYLDNLPYSANIQESQSINSPVAQMRGNDPDLKGNLTFESIGMYPAEDYFSVDPSSGRVSLIRDLKSDPSGLQTYTLRVVIYDSMYPRLKATGDVVINVLRNPFAPQFSPNADYRATVQENVTLGYQVLDIDANDSDNDPVTFEIVNSAPLGGENFFYLDPNTGVLTTKRLLTNTPETFYQLTVQASDGRGRAANATASITITRIPSDQRPVFISTPNATITFKRLVNSSVLTVAAQDPNLVGTIRYELVGIYPAQDFFAVNPSTGSVTVTRDLATDSFETMQYTLRLEAYDTNNPSLRAVGLSFITVIRNPATPLFSVSDYTHVAEETLQVGAMLFDINATDADGDRILYDVVQNQNGIAANEFFLLNRDSGQFYLIKDLRLTTQNAFSFTVRARDQGRPEKFATANVLISVTRDNGPPTFIQRDYIFEVPETEPVNNIIPFASIQAQDVPTRGSLVYEEEGDGLAMSYFALDRNTGAIKVQKSLLTTNESYFELKATAYDTFYPDNKANTTVRITVRRNQNEPQFSQSAYNTEINEYHQFGVTVFTVSAADADKDVVLFSIEPPNDFFYIEKYSGRIYLRRSPSENPTVSEYTFLVLASDQRSPPRIANATMTIRIRRNQPPVILELPLTITQSENTPVDSPVYTVKARDPDMRPTSRLVYTLIGDGSGPTFFSLNNLTGEIRIKAGFRNDLALQYVLRISVYDQEIMDMRTTSTLTISALRNTNQPRFNQRFYVYNITDTTQPSTVVGQPNATDFDEDRLQYFLTGDATAREYFYVNRDTAEIILIKNLDTTTVKTFNLQLTVEDGRVPLKTDTVQVTINVARDLALPIFFNDPYIFITDEERPINHTIGTVSAVDQDIRGQIQYEVVGIYPAPSFFDVDKDSGVIRIIRDLKEDQSATGTYVLRISAYDSRDPSKFTLTDVTITVARNSNPPVFDRTSYSIRITELYSMGIPVLNITATDPERTPISYTLVRDNTVGGNALVYFYIDANGGLYLRKPLTAPDVPGQFSMVVAATDSGRPSRTTEVNVFVGVDKINPPVFLGTPYTRLLEERTLNGTSIITVRTSPSTDIVYEIVGEPPAPYLFFVEQTGDIHIKKDLTTDKSMEYKIRVRAYQKNTPSKYAETDVVVTMLRNSNPPTFTPDSFSISVNYDDPVGKRVLQVQATDVDLLDDLQYSITGDADCRNSFYIISATGEIFLGKNLKTTNDVLFQCTLSVTDNGYPTPKTDTATLTINVVRGTNPVFGIQNLNVNTREDVPVGTVVENRISATRTPAPQSPDTMVYEIIGEYPAQSFFGIDRLTGQISVIQDLRLDGLKTTQYKVLVLTYGTDKPDLRSTATVTINVRRNLNGPRFFPQSDSIELPETTSTDFWSMPQNVTDPDSSKITCSIIGDPKSVEYFQVDPDTCVLSLKKSLKDDPDLTTTYNVLIEAVDNGQPPQSNTKTVTVTVPRDTSPPNFQNLPATITIDETRPVGDSVYTALATDNWRGKAQYSIVGDLPSPSFFQIDPNTGNITLRNSPKSDGLESTSYTVRIKVIDDAWPNNPQYGVLTVRVTRNTQGPQLQSTTYTRSIKASNPVGSNIVTIQASDPDGDKIVFVHRGTDDDKKYFYVHPETGGVIQIGDLSELPDKTFQFNVDVSDNRQPINTVTATVIINVTSLKGPPRFTKAFYNVNIPITSAVNSSVENIFAVDNDLEAQLMYNLIGFNPGTDYFWMQPSESFVNIRVKKSLLDNPDVTSYLLLLEAYDSKYPDDKSYASVTINILKNSNPPVIVPSSLSATVNDYDPPGTFVVDVNATDADVTLPEKTLLYAIQDGRAATDYFVIDPITGVITIDTRLSEDTTRPQDYVLRITARDTSSTPQTATATVTIAVNRNSKPSFINPARYVFSPSETVNVYDSLFQVAATDPDSATLLNGQLEFYFVGPVDASRVFGITPDTGSIYARISLRDVTQDQWTFTVGVRDKGIPPLFVETPVTANIQRIGKPTFGSTRYDVTEFENAPVDKFITQVLATDPMQGSTLVYEIRGDGLAEEYFKIGSDGSIRINKSLHLDDNKTPTYRIRVVAYRQSDPTQLAETFVYVLVIRNPNQPRFSHGNLQITINENKAVSSYIISVNASDADLGENGEIVYFFSTQESQPVYSTNYFYINPTTGDITLTANLRGDPNTPQYQLRVVARDKGVPSKQSGVTVTVVVERNPNQPEFIQRSYEADVNESIPVGSSVIQVAAQDIDGDTITYSISYNPPASLYFNIDSSSGLIRTATTLYQDEAERYVLLVTVSDGTLQGSATVTVRVHRNVHKPVFSNPNYNVTISEYEGLNDIIHRVIATDNDNSNSSSGVLRYSIVRSVPLSSSPVFIISSTTGEIQLAQSLTNNKTANQYTLTVMARDVSTSPKNATAVVTINIVRNNFAPEFSSQTYNASARDLDPYGKSVLNVTAADADRLNQYSANTPNALVSYSLPSDALTFNRYFQITPTGNLKVTQPLPSETSITSLPVRIRACDMSWNQKCSEIRVNIALSHHETQAGQLGFLQPVYYKEVSESLPLNEVIVTMDVEYQEENRIVCNIVDLDLSNKFSIITDNLQKNCKLTLLHQLDYSVQSRYNVTVSVRPDTSQSRRKRQIYVYNTHQLATVIIQVKDENNNGPRFIYPVYPVNPNELRMYFGAVANDSRPSKQVLEVQATDLDLGTNGLVTYSIKDASETPANTPFALSSDDGIITTKRDLSAELNKPVQYRFRAVASDNPVRFTEKQSDETNVIINLIRPFNRFVLVFKDKNPEDLLPKAEFIRQVLQNVTKHVAIIETIERKRYLNDLQNVQTDDTSVPDADVYFVLQETVEPFHLINNTRQDELFPGGDLGDLKNKIGGDPSLEVIAIRKPFDSEASRIFQLSKSYVWWLDDPWAALVALAAISILLCLVGLIVIIFTHSRYMRYVREYETHLRAFDQPEFVEPPSFLREYETQSLNMYVPAPDEAVHDLGEINMTFEGENVTAEHIGGDQGITSAVNPIYQEDDPQSQPPRPTGFTESTTML